MAKKKEANLISFKVVLTANNDIVTELSMLPMEDVDKVFKTRDGLFSFLGGETLSDKLNKSFVNLSSQWGTSSSDLRYLKLEMRMKQLKLSYRQGKRNLPPYIIIFRVN